MDETQPESIYQGNSLIELGPVIMVDDKPVFSHIKLVPRTCHSGVRRNHPQRERYMAVGIRLPDGSCVMERNGGRRHT